MEKIVIDQKKRKEVLRLEKDTRENWEVGGLVGVVFLIVFFGVGTYIAIEAGAQPAFVVLFIVSIMILAVVIAILVVVIMILRRIQK